MLALLDLNDGIALAIGPKGEGYIKAVWAVVIRLHISLGVRDLSDVGNILSARRAVVKNVLVHACR